MNHAYERALGNVNLSYRVYKLGARLVEQTELASTREG